MKIGLFFHCSAIVIRKNNSKHSQVNKEQFDVIILMMFSTILCYILIKKYCLLHFERHINSEATAAL